MATAKKKTEIGSKEEYAALYNTLTADNDMIMRKRPASSKATPKKPPKKK